MTDSHLSAYGAFILRVALGALFIAHAGLKLFVFTPAGTVAFFASLGLPAVFAYATMAAELFGGIALVLGVFTRVVSLALIPVLLGAIVMVHGKAGFFFQNPNGGWEFIAFWIVALVTQALIGEGAFALRLPSRVYLREAHAQ